MISDEYEKDYKCKITKNVTETIVERLEDFHNVLIDPPKVSNLLF